jgi:branched-chain amino acid transport system substrate-binding protein
VRGGLTAFPLALLLGCRAGEVAGTGAVCKEDADCRWGYTCDQGVCRAGDTMVGVPIQCNANGDCAGLATPELPVLCSRQKICVRGPDCTTTAECTTAARGEPSLCRKSDHKCTALTTGECEIKDTSEASPGEDTVWFGMLTPPSVFTDMARAADLARQAMVVARATPNLASRAPAPFGFITCASQNNAFERSLTHLVNVVRVPAIIGSTLSSEVLVMLNKYTIPAGVLVLSPAATAPEISDIDNKGLFYRMLGSDAVGVKALAALLRSVIEPGLRAGPPALDEPLRVAVLYPNDVSGNGFARRAADDLTFNGKGVGDNGARYRAVGFGAAADPNRSDSDARAAATMLLFHPHVILIFGGLDVSSIVDRIEKGWPLDWAPPVWLGSRGTIAVFAGASPSPTGGLDPAPPPLRRRFYGAQPFIDHTTDAFRAFERTYQKATGTAPSGLIQPLAYFDAAYLLAYAAAANARSPLTGASLSAAIRTRLTPGPGAQKLSVGEDGVPPVLIALDNGDRVDLQGIVGPLDFDDRGDAPQPQEFFCVTATPDFPGGPLRPVPGRLDMVYDPATDTLIGAGGGCLVP